MRRDPRSKLLRQHLRAKADPQKRALLAQRNGNPVDFAPNEFIRIVGAHRASEDDRAGMSVQGFGKGVAEARAADVEGVPERPQRIADAARRGGFLVQDDQDRQQCLATWTTSRRGLPPCRGLQPFSRLTLID